MAYVITDNCIKDELCIQACPVDCIHPRSDESTFEAATQTMAAAVRRLREADDRPWAESRDLLRALTAELAAHPNPIIQTAPEEILSSDLLHLGGQGSSPNRPMHM